MNVGPMMRYVARTVSVVLMVSLGFGHEVQISSKILPHPVYQNGNMVYIDTAGKVVITTRYTWALDFSEGLAGYKDKDKDKFGFINETGKEAIKAAFDSVESFSEGLAAIEINDKWGFIDKTGRTIIKPQFDFAHSFSEGLALVGMYVGDYSDGDDIYKWGYIDKTGTMVIGKTRKPVIIRSRIFSSPKFDEAEDFSEGLACVRVGSRWGYVNKQGQFVIQLQFNGAKSFSDGLSTVTYDGVKWGSIDR